MTDEQFEVLKKEFISGIKDYVVENGGIFPHITVFADTKYVDDEDKTKPALIHIPIPEELMMDDEGKDKFIDDIFPDIAKEIKVKFIPTALAWTSEVWTDKELIIITIESKNDKECVVYDIIRNGQSVNSDGEIIDNIELIESENSANPQSIEGRFSGLFNKLKD